MKTLIALDILLLVGIYFDFKGSDDANILVMLLIIVIAIAIAGNYIRYSADNAYLKKHKSDYKQNVFDRLNKNKLEINKFKELIKTTNNL